MKKVSIIGAGNGGLTAAYHLSKIGNSVCIYDSPMFDTQINAINNNGGIEALEELHECKMSFSGFEKITKATTDVKEAVEFSDVPYLLVACYEFAKLAGIKVPIVESCINIASAYNDENYFETGRTLEKMGLDNMSIEEIINYVSGVELAL